MSLSGSGNPAERSDFQRETLPSKSFAAEQTFLKRAEVGPYSSTHALQ